MRLASLTPADAGPGYQRLLNEGRAKKLSDYILDGQTEKDAFLPTSIFLADEQRHRVSFCDQYNHV